MTKTPSKAKRPVGRPRADGKPHLNRLAIYTSAAKLIAELGYGGASLRKIAADLDVSAPSILNFFPSKEALLNELIKVMAARTLSFHKALFKADLAADVCLYKMMYEEVLSILVVPELTRLFYLPELRLAGFEKALAQRTAMFENFLSQVKAGQKQALLRSGNARLMAEQCLQLTETSMIAVDGAKLGSHETQAQGAADFVLRALLVKPARLDSIRKKALACEVNPDRQSALT